MLTAALSSHSELLTACGKTSHDGRAVKPTTGPQNLFPRDYRPTSLQRPPRQQSLPVSKIGFVSKFPKPTGRRLFSRAAIAQFCTKSPIGFVFSVHGPWVLHAQICTNMHKSAQRPHSTIAGQLSKIGFVPQKRPDHPSRAWVHPASTRKPFLADAVAAARQPLRPVSGELEDPIHSTGRRQGPVLTNCLRYNPGTAETGHVVNPGPRPRGQI